MNTRKTKEKCFNVIGFKRLYCFMSFVILIASVLLAKRMVQAEEPSISIKEINYDNSTITLQVNSLDTKVFLSDANMKKWDAVPGTISNGMITVDMSWISASSNQTITFKGDYSTKVVSITIPKQATKFKATYNKIKGTISFSNTDNRTIEWRKKGSTTWNRVNANTLSDELNAYYTNGIQLYFRLAPVNGSGTYAGLRPSKEVSVTIPKRTAAPKVTVNGSKFIIPVKKGMSYRRVYEDGTMSQWTNVTGTTELLLSSVASEALYNGNTGTQKEVTLQFRTNASASSQVSNITTVVIPIQKGAPDIATSGISINYTSSSSLTLTVKAASSKTPYEYTIIQKDKELNYQTAVWKTISSSSPVSINSTAAPTGSKIYVRLKSIEASNETEFSLASVEVEVTGGSGVNYPDASHATQLTTLVATAGVCQANKSASYLTFYLYTPTSTTVSSIDIYDVYGSKKGSVSCKSTVKANSNSTGSNDKYIITTNITSTEEINKYTEEILYAYITLSNNEVIKSNSTAGVQLYLYPSTKVNNPNDKSYSKEFDRIYMSTDASDAKSFKFQLDFGTEKVVDSTGFNKFKDVLTEISSMKYNNYTLNKDSDYTVEYGTYVDEDNSTVRTATVTVNVSNFEKAANITVTEQYIPLIITLNNNEVLDDLIKIKMIRTATLDNIPIAWTITEGSLPEKITSTVTNEDGSTTTVTQEAINFSLTLSMFSDTYSVSVANVTWGGSSIFGSATVSNGKVTIYLSNAKINKLNTDSTETKNVVITFSNGYVIDTGCKLTILNAD